MRTTLILDDSLIEKARTATGVREKTRLIHLGLESLVRQAAAKRLAKLGGSDPKAAAPARHRA
jgi:Arc/MetJ family transcription regulator